MRHKGLCIPNICPVHSRARSESATIASLKDQSLGPGKSSRCGGFRLVEITDQEVHAYTSRRLVNSSASETMWTSALGLVSRASPVHTAMRNCTRDEGALRDRQSGADLKPPQAAAVKSRGGERCGNVGTRSRQARSREASASEPLQKCRKAIRRCQNRGVTHPPGSARGMPETARATSGM